MTVDLWADQRVELNWTRLNNKLTPQQTTTSSIVAVFAAQNNYRDKKNKEEVMSSCHCWQPASQSAGAEAEWKNNLLPLTKRLPALLATPNWFLATHVYSPASILVTLEIRRLPLSNTVTLWVKEHTYIFRLPDNPRCWVNKSPICTWLVVPGDL